MMASRRGRRVPASTQSGGGRGGQPAEQVTMKKVLAYQQAARTYSAASASMPQRLPFEGRNRRLRRAGAPQVHAPRRQLPLREQEAGRQHAGLRVEHRRSGRRHCRRPPPAPTEALRRSGPSRRSTSGRWPPSATPSGCGPTDQDHVGPVSDKRGRVVGLPRCQLTKTVFKMGDGQTVTCRDGGTPYTKGTKAATPSPDCGYRYEKPSLPKGDYTVTAIGYWAVTWTVNGTSGVITVPRAASAPLPVWRGTGPGPLIDRVPYQQGAAVGAAC